MHNGINFSRNVKGNREFASQRRNGKMFRVRSARPREANTVLSSLFGNPNFNHLKNPQKLGQHQRGEGASGEGDGGTQVLGRGTRLT